MLRTTALLASLLVAGESSAALRLVDVRWLPSPSSGVVGYELHVGTRSSAYARVIDLGSGVVVGSAMQAVVALDDATDQYLAMRAVDALGYASPLSNEVIVPAYGSGTKPVSDVQAALLTGVGIAANTAGNLAIADASGGLAIVSGGPSLADGKVQPARCDVDGDGDVDLVVGYRRATGAEITVLEMQNGRVEASIGIDLLASDPVQLAHLAGIESRPACGDPDGDGRLEIVVAFGRGSLGTFLVVDDWTTGFEVLPAHGLTGERFMESWQFFMYRHLSGDLRPALGDVDGDGHDELLLATVREWVVVLDDAAAGFVLLAELGSPGATPTAFWAPFYIEGGDPPTSRVAAGELDGDPAAEVVVGVDGGGKSFLVVFDDAASGWQSLLTTQDPAAAPAPLWVGALVHMGASAPSLVDLDGDGIDEVVGRPALLPRGLQVLDFGGGRLVPRTVQGDPNGLVDPGIFLVPLPGL